MKTVVKIFTLALATIFLLASTAIALPANTVVIGDKAYSIEAIMAGTEGIQAALDASDGKLYYNLEGQTSGFVGLFNGQAMTQAQKDELKDIEYTKADGSKTIYPIFDQELAVVGTPTVVNATTISVSFNDNVTKEFTVSTLSVGANTRTITYKGKNFSVDVNYAVPTPAATKVESINFINYRNIRVTFDGIVDKASAKNAANYYFEIVDGDADYGALPTLRDSNQLSRIQTNFPGGASEWWKNGIEANDVNGKTIVDIHLPEDARFTTIEDGFIGNYPSEIADAERTLAVEMRTSKTDGETLKKLIKDTSVNVAVRNIKDISGNFTINTAVMPIRILDEVKPELVEVKKINAKRQLFPLVDYGSLGRDLGTYELYKSCDSKAGEMLQFTYSEPVFDAHRLDESDLEYYRDIKLYVNGNEIASLSRGNLKDYMNFAMGVDATYDAAKIVTMDVEKAVKDTCHEKFATGLEYIIRFVGVTDLAGNIEVSSEHTFKVKFKDQPIVQEDIVYPVVIGVDQVADNIFRIEFNRDNVEGTLVIFNPDGEGVGILRKHIGLSVKSGSKYYSYVAVPARDSEPAEAIPQGIEQNMVLAYDKQDEIYRDIRVDNVVVREENDPISDVDLHGPDFQVDNMKLVDDILAPIIVQPDTNKSIDYYDRGSSLSIQVVDKTPWVYDGNMDYWVSPIAYKYNFFEKRFENEIMADQTANPDNPTYLPLIVSYVDSNGAKHEAVVSNYDLRPYWFWGSHFSDLNLGYSGSILFNDATDTLNIDLHHYKQLLDSHGKLVAGVTYTVEFQPGYFTDSPKDTNMCDDDKDAGVIGTTSESTYDLDMLYVDDGRDADDYAWIKRPRHRPELRIVDSGLGYTSTNKKVTINVGTKPPMPPAEEYVPQTSKQLITYDEPTRSIRVEFTGTIDVSTLTNKANYSFDGKTLAEWDALLGTNTVIDYVVNDAGHCYDHQFAQFIVPQDSIAEDGDYAFLVQGVAHPDGGKMTPVETVIRLRDNTRPVVISAKVAGLNQIKLTFNEPIRYHVDPAKLADPDSTARNFLLKIGGTVWTVKTAVLPSGADNNREIILNIGNNIPTSGDITVEIVPDQNGNILVIDYSENENPMRTATYNVTRAQ